MFPGLSRIGLGILFLIVEMFIGTFDFLVIGISGIITGICVYLMPGLFESLFIQVVLFSILSTVTIIISRKYLVSYLKKNIEKQNLTADKIIGEKLLVQKIEKGDVVYYEGNYRELISDSSLNQGDTVEILEIIGNKLKIKKIF